MNSFLARIQASVTKQVPVPMARQLENFAKVVLPLNLQLLMRGLALIPYLVAGIQQIHGDEKAGAEKKQLATEALNLAVFGATVVDPSQSQAIALAQQVFSVAIDGAKAVYNAAQHPAAPAPVAPTSVLP